MNKKSYDEVQKKLEKNPFDQVIPMITKDIPSYKELNSEEEKILIRLEELYKMKMQYMSIPEEKEKFKRKIYEDIISGKVECPKGYSKEQYFNALIQSFEIQSNINVEESKTDIKIKKDEDNLDGLNFLAGKTMDYVNKQAMQGTIEAHASGGVPNIIINIKKLNEETIGELIYFFELACAISGNILGVNPFDQPGVEAYKKNMFRLLGKPGYEK